MEKTRAARNRTITLDSAQITHYASRCLRPTTPLGQEAVIDTFLQGDLFAYAPLLPSASVDLLIVDPPYNLSKTFGASTFQKMATDDYLHFTRQWIEAIRHTLKPNATIYVCCDWKTSMLIGAVLGDYFTLQNRISWQREKGRGASRNWKNGMEDIWFATLAPKDYVFHVEDVKMRRQVIAPYKSDGKPKDWVESDDGKFRDTFPSNFWDDISIPYWSMPENTDHPTQKPEKLFAKLILASSEPNALVFDPFAGVGTAAVTAKKLGRHYLAIEQEQEYCALAQKRLELATDDTQIQGYCGGVFWERNTLALQQRHQNPSL